MTIRLNSPCTRTSVAFALILVAQLLNMVSLAHAQPDLTNPQTVASIIDSIDSIPQAVLPPELKTIPIEELSIGPQIWQLHWLANDFFDQEPSTFVSTMNFVEPEDVWMGTVLHNGLPVATIFMKQMTNNPLEWSVSKVRAPNVALNVASQYQDGYKLVRAGNSDNGMYLLHGLDLIGVDDASATACPAPCTLSLFWNVYHGLGFAQATQMASLPPLTQDQVATAEAEGGNAATLQAAGFKIETPVAMSPNTAKATLLAQETSASEGSGSLLVIGGTLALVLLLAAIIRRQHLS